ncbi:MAG: enoyl-CoA hydratase-related protein [Rickettsiales bacterium]
MSDLVRFEKRGSIGIITVDNPPVNALSPGVPEGMAACVAKGNADPDVKAMVLIGEGGKFIAGADIKQWLDREGLDLIVEKIEDERQVVELLDYEIDFGQGFLFGEPRLSRTD